jgi:Ca-activated chloride channel family protein
MKSRFLFVLAFIFAAAPLFADGLIVVHRPPPIGHGGAARPHGFAPLEVVFHHVEVNIDGQKAVTRVDQEFFNPNGATLEGEYLFPIPAGAHIDRFTMRVGDRDLEAELLDAGKAREIYERIVREQRDPALLEYTGRPAFRVRIFPIEARAGKRVQLKYTELLRNDGGMISYLYPLNTEKFSAQPLKRASIRVQVAQASPLRAIYSPSHPVDIRRDGDRRAMVGWETADARPDRDFQLLLSTAESEVGVSLVAQKAGGEDGWFLLLASPGAEGMRPGERANPKDVVFVLDTSGSMAGKKLEQAQKALTFCIENLNDGDRFEVLRFATETETCFDRLADAGRDERKRARAWIEGLRPIGGTAIHEALQRAMGLRPKGKERPFVVIFLTDGQPTVGETGEDRIVASVAPERLEGGGSGAPARIFCFGIGTDVNTHLLDKIAERTRAATQFVLPEEDLEVKVSSFFTKIREPLLTDLRIEWPAGVRVSQMYPNPLPDLFRGDQLVVTGRYSGSGEGEIVLDGTLNGQPRRMLQRVHFPDSARGNEFVPQLWATRRVGWLLDEIRLRGESRELREEVVDLARRFAIVTPYTSYLIVEDEARRGVPVAGRTLQRLDADRLAREYLERNWHLLPAEKAGAAANFNARANKELRDSLSVAEPQAASGAEQSRALAANAPAGAAMPPLEVLQNAAKVVRGKAFYQNGAQWLDAETQRAPVPQEKRRRIQFASEDYFRLLAEQPSAAPWLALGRNVQFSLGDEWIEIAE